jgi:Mn-dependent DtxR family transcriptional regulator
MAPIPDAELLDAIRRIDDRTDGYVTYQAIASELGLARSGIHRRVQRLAAAGYITVIEGRGGGVRLLERTTPEGMDGTIRVSIDLAVVAGQVVAVRLVD